MVSLSPELEQANRELAQKRAEAPKYPQAICPPPDGVAAKSAPNEKAKRLSKLTNVSKVKEAALAFAKQHRAKAFTRVSQSFLDAIEAEVRVLIHNRVKRQPSVGKTLT